jgi:hypothetical protein
VDIPFLDRLISVSKILLNLYRKTSKQQKYSVSKNRLKYTRLNEIRRNCTFIRPIWLHTLGTKNLRSTERNPDSISEEEITRKPERVERKGNILKKNESRTMIMIIIICYCAVQSYKFCKRRGSCTKKRLANPPPWLR